MLATLALMIAAQGAAAVPAVPEQSVQQKDVAYEAVAAGNNAQAIAALEARLREDPQDPATLINLGTVYARSGDAARAAQAFRAAMASDTRYQLELADGRWVDSRIAARRALDRLGTGYTVAALGD